MNEGQVAARRNIWSTLRRATTVAILAVPLTFTVLALQLQDERGPFWLGTNSDPSYVYLFSSLLLVNGQAPFHIDHPGTPVQSLGALFLLGSAMGDGVTEITNQALSDPERALNKIHRGLFALSLAALAFAGVLVYRRTNSVVMAVCSQLSAILLVEGAKGTLYVTPEHLLVSLVVLLNGLLAVRYLAEATDGGGDRFKPIDWTIGVLAGTALATKITFAPLLALPFLVRPNLRYGAWMAAAITTGVMVNLSPIVTQIPRMLDFFGRISTHTGYLGGGQDGFVDPAVYWSHVRMLFQAAPFLLVVWSAAVVVCVIGWLGRAEAAAGRVLALRLAGVTAVQIGGVLFVAKHPNVHYMLPTWLSTSLSLCLMVAIVRQVPRVTAKTIGWATIVLTVSIGSQWSRQQFAAMTRVLHDARDSQLLCADRVRQATAGDRVAHYYRCASPEFALCFGNGYSRQFFGKRLEETPKMSGALFFNVFNARFETFTDSMAPDAIYSDRHPVFFFGSGSIDTMPFGLQFPLPEGWEKTEVLREGQYVLHRVAPAEPTASVPGSPSP